MDTDEENLSPEQREKLMKELKQRLKEIEELKQSLHILPQSDEEKNDREAKTGVLENTPSNVRSVVEELRVPPLELLRDEPLPKKKKGQESST